MQPDRSLHVCLIGDPDTGHSAFLNAYRGCDAGATTGAAVERLERFFTIVELDGEQYCIRFTDGVGTACFETMWRSVLGTAHAIILCFDIDQPHSLRSLTETWMPLIWAVGCEAPYFILGLNADRRVGGSPEACVLEEEGSEVALRHGAMKYMECSTLHPESVRQVMDDVLLVARDYFCLQWQLGPRPEGESEPIDESVDTATWLEHERLNIADDHAPLDLEMVQKNLSMLGNTTNRQHAYLRIDLADLGLTSVDSIRGFPHLQFANISGNRLRSLEPLGALRCLLHLNASFNLVIRTQCLAAPEQLETVDMSYNMIRELGDWAVHKYLRELNLRGNFIERIGPGLRRNRELRMLDMSENYLAGIENLEGLGLHTLYLAQNRLTSLQGIGSLNKLQVLNVKHNAITSISALRSEELARLRKLCVSENRVSHIREIETLQSFPFLCDLLLAPNPIEELPHYRAQVLHRLPRLRLLDRQAASAEEKVKAGVIYGADVESRKEIFMQQLPDEAFVDRRLTTEEGIAETERGRFGEQGNAGEFGGNSDVSVVEALRRNQFQEAKLQQRLSIARRGGNTPGVADFATFPAPFLSFKVSDDDLDEIFEVAAEGCIERLNLSGAQLGSEAILGVLNVLKGPGPLRHIELSRCEAVSQVVDSLVNDFPYERGCSLEASNCNIEDKDVEKLRNNTPQAEAVRQKAAAVRERTKELRTVYRERQQALEEFAVECCNQESPPDLPPPLFHPLQWRDGIDVRACAAHRAFCAANPGGLVENRGAPRQRWSMTNARGVKVTLSDDEYSVLDGRRRSMLTEFGSLDMTAGEVAFAGSRPLPAAYESAFSPVSSSSSLIGFMLWNGARPVAESEAEKQRQQEEWTALWQDRKKHMLALGDAAKKTHDLQSLPVNVASGQLIAHFTYLSLGRTLKGGEAVCPPARFGLKHVVKQTRPKPNYGVDLFEVLSCNKALIESIAASGHGLDSVELRIKSLTREELDIVVQRGTILQHPDWQHRQNLLVAVDYLLTLPAMSILSKKISTHSMNLSCALPERSDMNLTEFYVDDHTILEGQGAVWDHFEGCFNAPT